MLKKTIQINPELFNIGNKKKKKREKKKLSPFSSALKPNDIKKQLIQRVKDHHKKKRQELEFEKKKEENNKAFTNDFNDTFKYLEKITHENKKKRKKRKQRKQKTLKYHDNKPDPPYGCLKNASKPTFRQYNKTLKKQDTNVEKINIEDKPQNTDDNSERKNKLDELKEKFDDVVATIDLDSKSQTTETPTNTEKKEKRRRKMKKFKTKKIKRKFTLGKSLKSRSVGVLINNKNTRKKIKNDHNKLHTKSTTSVKKYLLKHNLMKVGSTCPEEILRVTYENSYLTGDVINKNPDILLHNYMQES